MKTNRTNPKKKQSFNEGVISRAKDFFSKTYNNIKRRGREIVRDFRKKYSNTKKKENFVPGRLLSFQYRAKHNEKKFDRNPLVIVLGPPKNPKLKNTHVYGLNLHWLPVKDRVAIASYFIELKDRRGGKLRYEDIKQFIYKFKGHQVLRMYIIKNISNRVVDMPDDVYLTAVGLDTAMWVN